MGDFLHHSAGHRWLNVQPRSAYLSEWPFTLFVRFLSSLTLSVFPYLFYFLSPPHAIPFSLPQPSTWPISVRLLSCTILCVLASRYSSVTLLPVAVPLLPSLPPTLLLYVVKTLYISLQCISPKHLFLPLLRNPPPFCLAFLFYLSTFGLTFYFNVSACLPSPAGPRFPLLLSTLSCVYIIFIFKCVLSQFYLYFIYLHPHSDNDYSSKSFTNRSPCLGTRTLFLDIILVGEPPFAGI